MKRIINGISVIFSEEVSDALNDGVALVALESNVITHGFEYPENIITAKKVEEAVRRSSAVPATIGIDNGSILIGMTDETIERFSSTAKVPKVSSRDLPVILAKRGIGATTVASSIVAAELANIKFFASAGIGGVHRGAETSMDISSDLIQFTRSKVAVVCAGAKKILDLNLTMEFLETHCVPVISYLSDDFPAFYCISSGIKSPHRMDNVNEIAEAIELHWKLGNNSSILITSPTQKDDAIDSDEIESAIKTAILDAEKAQIRGNDITKYIMRAVDKVTDGHSTKANKAVLINTAEVAGQLAVAHSKRTAV